MSDNYTWHFGLVWEFKGVFLRGAVVTLSLAVGALLIAMLLGLVLGMLRSSKRKYLSAPAIVYIEFFRSTPTLVQLVWIYYSLPILTGIQLGSFVAVMLGLGLHSAAYMAEIFRAGVNSIDQGQWDAARSIGMSHLRAARRIILPQAVRRMIPPFINEFANLMKLTTLGSVVAVYELLHESDNLIASTYRPLEIYTTLAVVFAIIIFPFIFASQRLERYWRVRS
jgi:polar amino acid transport system permease protein